MSDNVNGIENLVRYAYKKGHRRISYIHGNPTAVTENRLAGFHRVCRELEIELPEEYITSCDYHETVGCNKATKKLLKLKVPPTCILFSDDFAAIGGLNAIHELGLRVPADVSVIGYDGTNLAQVMSPKLTTWCQNTDDIGKTIAEKLIERIENPQTTIAEYLVVQGRLFNGETVRDLN